MELRMRQFRLHERFHGILYHFKTQFIDDNNGSIK